MYYGKTGMSRLVEHVPSSVIVVLIVRVMNSKRERGYEFSRAHKQYKNIIKKLIKRFSISPLLSEIIINGKSSKKGFLRLSCSEVVLNDRHNILITLFKTLK